MRIRKNTKLSSLLFPASHGGGGGSGGERPQTHVCHLNQSPWDVIQFSSSTASLSNLQYDSSSSWFLPSSSSSPSPHFRQLDVDGDGSFNGNVSLGDSNGAVESVVSVEKLDFMDEEPTDLTGWTRNSSIKGKISKAHEPNSSQKSSGDKISAATTSTMPPRRGRPRGTVKKASATATATGGATNPYEFYYYSGFGPRWGKRRGGGGSGSGSGSGTKSVAAEEETVMSTNGISIIKNYNKNSGGGSRTRNNEVEGKTASFEEDDDDDYMDDDDEEEEEEEVDQENDCSKMKKRGRKPVKARSLKSLM